MKQQLELTATADNLARMRWLLAVGGAGRSRVRRLRRRENGAARCAHRERRWECDKDRTQGLGIDYAQRLSASCQLWITLLCPWCKCRSAKLRSRSMTATLPPPDNFPAIRLCVGYQWGKDKQLNLIAAKSDPRWQPIRGFAMKAGEAVRRSLTKRKPASTPFRLDIARLRGTHGQFLLQDLRERIQSADILIFDIGPRDGAGFNQNVLIELGMALAATPPKHVFILKQLRADLPSDLQGFLVTNYEESAHGGGFRLLDALGFHAALRSAIRRVAESRGMVGPARHPFVGAEEDE